MIEWLRNTRNAFDLFQRGWNNWVVAFSSDSQSRLLSMFGWDALDSAKLVIAMIAICLVIGAIIYILSPLLLIFRSARQQAPLLRLWKKFIRKLTKAGFSAHPSMGPLELAVKARDQLQYKGDGIHRIAELYMLSRYSQEAGRQAELAVLIDSFQPQPAPQE